MRTWLFLCMMPAIYAGAVRQDKIVDPVLNMVAFEAKVPQNWRFDGALFQGTTCEHNAFPVFRAYSPDGLTEVRRYPRLDWTWGNNPFMSKQQHPDCLKIEQQLSAQDFIKYILGVLQMAYVRDAPVNEAALAQQQAFLDKLNASSAQNAKILHSEPMKQTITAAAAFAEYRNGTFAMEAHINANVSCTHAPMGPKQFVERCSATMRVIRAPKGQLEAAMRMIDTDQIGLQQNMQWVQRYMQKMTDRNNAILASFRQQAARAQEIRNQQHEQFMATMRAGTDRALANARAVANSNHAIAQDWCDYALDRQTVTGAGGTVKVSSAYGHTWTNGSGQYYQTNDPNTNPNGSLPGAWSETTKVHGDGTPYK